MEPVTPGRHGGRVMRRRAAMVACALVAAGVIAACGSSSTKSSASAKGGSPASSSGGHSSGGGASIKIGVTPAQITFAPIFYAQAGGYFKKAGVNVTLVDLQNGTAELAAALGGDVDLVGGSAGTFADATAKGGDLVAVNGLAKMSEEVCVMKSWAQSKGLSSSSPTQQRLQALKGSILGDTSAGSSSQTDFEFLLKKYGGMDPQSDVHFTSTSSPAGAEAALKTGKIRAFLLSPPTCQAVPGAEPLVEPTEVPTFDAMINNVVFAKSSYVKSNSATVTKAMTAVADAADYLKAHPAAAAAKMSSYYTGEPQALLTDAIKKVALRYPAGGRMTEAMWKATSDMLVGSGEIHSALDPAEGKYWTNQYVKGSDAS